MPGSEFWPFRHQLTQLLALGYWQIEEFLTLHYTLAACCRFGKSGTYLIRSPACWIEVAVIGHQAECLNLPTGFLAGFGQGRQEEHAILVVPDNGFAPVATIEQVIARARILDAQLSGRAEESAPATGEGQ